MFAEKKEVYSIKIKNRNLKLELNTRIKHVSEEISMKENIFQTMSIVCRRHHPVYIISYHQ